MWNSGLVDQSDRGRESEMQAQTSGHIGFLKAKLTQINVNSDYKMMMYD